MAKTRDKGPVFHLKPFIDWVGMKEVVDQVGLKRVIDEVGIDQVIGQLAKDHKAKKKILARLLDGLSPAERAELKRRLEERP